ncbi:xanthine dehydrogenase family protein molybdopterin-binding subunit [Kordiimonas sp. SCSIO 12610]|uniref:xanthine dehydrogenase family protein molybdopterin-binding subunit n=1 Tax=Kordiimonas sp. SCSIO 12610 TaxID=2829597 RepID=UPI002109D447|nr:molybdopterin cofactor-binding domain-containing protein [Kordiimonas sp. SCSIO 12610]UTW54575.1 xanthine dehydrogenase family protein molybdopterin-binding subunit [Kordiimonas sp. SCSIO 12610]
MTRIHNVSKNDYSRRGFLKGAVATGSLVLAANVIPYGPLSELQAANADNDLVNSAYLSISPDGTVNIFIHRVEMGQGSRTGLPMIIADELDADWERLNFVPAFGDKKFGDQNTDGSTSIRRFYDAFRRAGAGARMMLQQAAANKWGVSVGQVDVKNHRLINTVSGASADFADFVEAASKLSVPADADLVFKAKADWKYVGKPKQIIDMKGIVTGTADFGQDIKREGMLFAVATRPPAVGGKITSYDKAAAMAVSGVVDVVEMPVLEFPALFKPLGGVAVVATNTWAAKKGVEALNAQFEGGVNGSYDTEAYEAELWQSVKKGGTNHLNRGDVDKAISEAAKTFEADYFVPHLAHAPMEPMSATAEWIDGKLHIWTSCQDPQSVQSTVAPFVQQKPEDIYVEAALLGGAFGRKSKPDFAVEAALLATKMKKPVKVVWMREDDIKHGYYHTITAQSVKAGLDENGKVKAWHHKTAYPSIGGTFDPASVGPGGFEMGLGLTDMPFEIDNLRVEAGEAKQQVRIGWMRSVANIQQAFALGSFVDELAHNAGVNTVDYWMELIGSDRYVNPADDGAQYGNYGQTLEQFPIDTARLKAVLAKVADMADFKRKRPKGRGVGISVHRSFVSYVASAIEVEVSDAGEVKVLDAWMAVDCGLAVNPDRVKAQMEGAVVFGLSLAMHSEITAKDGAIVQGNFDDYQVCRTDEVPNVEVAIIENDAPPGGVGEPGVPPVAPAFTNAVFAASGKRIRRLPLGDQLYA